jgi:hypothetical protein
MVTFFSDFTGLETVRFFGRRTAFAISAAFAWQIFVTAKVFQAAALFGGFGEAA